jgi:hypothetical protein
VRLLLDMNLTPRWAPALAAAGHEAFHWSVLGAASGIILLRGEPLVPESRGEGLIGAIAACSAELDAGAILTLDWSGRSRARLLPLK